MSRSPLVTSAGNVDAEKIATEYRQTVQLGGDGATDLIDPKNADPAATDYGLPTRLIGQVAHDEVDIGSPVKIGGRVHSGVAVAAGDRVDARFTQDGGLLVYPGIMVSNKAQVLNDTIVNLTISRALVDGVAIGTTATVVSGVASKYIYVLGFVLSVDTSTAKITFEATTGGANAFVYQTLANVVYQVWAPSGMFLFSSSIGDGINLLSSAANNALGMIYYATSSSTLS